MLGRGTILDSDWRQSFHLVEGITSQRKAVEISIRSGFEINRPIKWSRENIVLMPNDSEHGVSYKQDITVYLRQPLISSQLKSKLERCFRPG